MYVGGYQLYITYICIIYYYDICVGGGGYWHNKQLRGIEVYIDLSSCIWWNNILEVLSKCACLNYTMYRGNVGILYNYFVQFSSLTSPQGWSALHHVSNRQLPSCGKPPHGECLYHVVSYWVINRVDFGLFFVLYIFHLIPHPGHLAFGHLQVRLGDRAVVGLFKGWRALVLVFVFLSSGFCLVLALVARDCYCLFIVVFVWSFRLFGSWLVPFTSIFFIDISFVLLPPPPVSQWRHVGHWGGLW